MADRTGTEAAGPGPGSKRQQEVAGDVSDFKRFCRSWAWKREHRPDRDRFHRPFKHTLVIPTCIQRKGSTATAQQQQQQEGSLSGNDGQRQGKGQQQPSEERQQEQHQCTLTIKQAKFNAEGFASTVWDSSIVLSKWAERWASKLTGKRCLDLSAGCGLVGVVLAKLGADVVATDLAANLPLLHDNCEANVPGAITVHEHRWGESVEPLGPPFDFVFGCDLMYIEGAIPDLVKTLHAIASWARAAGAASGMCLKGSSNSSSGDAGSGRGSEGGGGASSSSGGGTCILIAHGRNRGAEGAFLKRCSGVFAVERVRGDELDPVYQCSDVDVLRLTQIIK